MFSNKLQSILQEIEDIIQELREDGCPDPFFRGQGNCNWNLKPKLFRKMYFDNVESRLYSRFVSLGQHLMKMDNNTWNVLFYMQHHGLPTRLLDWSESLLTALYFSISKAKSDSAIWIVNPYELNEQVIGRRTVEALSHSYKKGYIEYFLNENSKYFDTFPEPVLAIDGSHNNSRMRSQRSVFTIHSDRKYSLEHSFPEVVKKVIIPKELISEMKRFLELSCYNEFSVFPDLDGLSRYLMQEECENQSLKYNNKNE